MNSEVLKGLFDEIEDANDWMHDSAGNDCGATAAELDKDSGDIYEVVVLLHLVNASVITLHNRCKESYIKGSYEGDNIFVSNNMIYAEWDDANGVFHQSRINPESIVMIDQYDEKVDWKDLIK